MIDLCVLNDHVSFYKVIFTICLPLKSLLLRSDFEPRPKVVLVMHADRRPIVPQLYLAEGGIG